MKFIHEVLLPLCMCLFRWIKVDKKDYLKKGSHVKIENNLWILITLKAAKSEARDQQFINKIVKKISKAKKTHDKHYKSMEWLNPKMKENFIRLREAPYFSNDKTNEQIIEFKKRQIAIENIFSDLSGATNKLFLNK